MTPQRQEQMQLPANRWAGRLLDARLYLLDHQIVNDDGEPVGTVDDLELSSVPVHTDIAPDTPAPTVTALVTGAVLLTRIFGGHPPRSRMQFIPFDLVHRIGTAIELRANNRKFESQWFEHWLRDRIVERIPGGKHRAGK